MYPLYASGLGPKLQLFDGRVCPKFGQVPVQSQIRRFEFSDLKENDSLVSNCSKMSVKVLKVRLSE